MNLKHHPRYVIALKSILNLAVSLPFIFKKTLINSNFGRTFDKYLRLVLNRFLSVALVPHQHRRVDKQKFVFFLYGGLGDIVSDSFLIDTARKQHRITPLVILPAELAPIIETLGFSFDIKTYTKENFFRDMFATRKLVKGMYFFAHHLSLESLLTCFILGIKIGAGFYKNYKTILLVDGQKQDTLPHFQRHNRVKHALSAVFGNMELAKTVKLENKNTVSLLLTKAGDRETSSPGMLEAWLGVLSACADSNVNTVFLIGDSSGEGLAAKIKTRLKRKNNFELFDFVGKTNLVQAIEKIRQSELAISVDSGLSHVALALGIPVLKLFAFTHPKHFTWGELGDFVFNPEYSCMPCVSETSEGLDNYHVICRYSYRCLRTLDSELLRKRTKQFISQNEYSIS